MTIRKIHSNNITGNRQDILTQYNEIFFDDEANSILLPDPTGLLESKIGSSSTSVGIGNTQVQKSVIFTTTSRPPMPPPMPGARSVERIEYQIVGDRVRLTYKLGMAAGSAGSGDYLLSLPTGLTFNLTYHPMYNNLVTPWDGNTNGVAPYHIVASGGIIIPGHWTNQIMVVPFDTTKFRLLCTNNNSQTTYQFWNSGWYAVSSPISLNLQFEIWR